VASRDEPWAIPAVNPDCTSPTLDLHLEQHLVVDGRNALMGRLVNGKLLVGLDQQRVLNLVERDVGAWYRLPEVIAQASQGGPHPPGHG
jgi:hypothetical protein